MATAQHFGEVRHGSMGLVESNFVSYQYHTTRRAGVKQPSWNSVQNLLMECPSSLWAASRSVVTGGAVLSSFYSTWEEYKARAAALKGRKEKWNPEKSTEPRNFHLAFEALGWQCQFKSLAALLHPFANLNLSVLCSPGHHKKVEWQAAHTLPMQTQHHHPIILHLVQPSLPDYITSVHIECSLWNSLKTGKTR